ncbi:TetR/AcrR family transcriptional regulator [Bradyrhizobium sp. 2TAF24]|uniref:TetR/AcrR family transcriptional regulator n=1 Tax=Bradyrhizobium sp. 2TAF24 TaxID=3233011 RepID=UPI003F8E1886
MSGADHGVGLRERRRKEGQARILEAARQLFETDGVAGLSIRMIAKRAGMPAMTLYRYFPHKTAIVRALWSEAFAPLFVELDAAEAAETEPRARLRRVAQTFVDYWLRFPARYKVVFLIEDRRESEEDRWFIEETDVVPELRRFSRLLAALQDDTAADPAAAGEALFCALIGVTHLLVGMPEYRWASSQTYIDRILRGFC